MRIGVDCTEIYDVKTKQGAGIARYVFYLVENILQQARENNLQVVLFFKKGVSEETISHLKSKGEFEYVLCDYCLRFFGRHVFLPWKIRQAHVDKIIFPANTMPLFSFLKTILVIHDLAIFLNPEWFPRQWFSTKILVPFSLVKSEKVVCISKNTQKDLLKLFPFVKNSQVIYPAACVVAGQSVGGEQKGDYLLFISTFEPRKNLVNILQAFRKFWQNGGQEKFYLIGSWGWKSEEIKKEFNKIQQEFPDKIKILGVQDDAQKTVLLQNARALVFPTLYEGFGMPVVEAMQLGVPVITSNRSSLAEIAQDVAILVDPSSVEQIYLAIKKILEDQELREHLTGAGKQRATQFSWHKTAQEFINPN